MGDDSLQHLQLGIESVVATVTGYHGSERFNLIKLISQAGASYVGNMNPSVTHLVCWKFEGRKYELAKKLKMEIVNHRWIEECVKKGRRVSERPYSFRSGKEVGHLLLDPPSRINIAKSQSEALKKSKQPVVDIDSEDTNNGPWVNALLVDELEETGTSQTANSSRVKKRNSTLLKPQGNPRRLVKKHINKKDELLFSKVLEGLDEGKALTRNTSSVNLSDSSASKRPHHLPGCSSRKDNTDVRDDVEEVRQESHENRDTSSFSAPSLPSPSSEKIPEAAHMDSINVDAGKRAPTLNEPTCIICLTDFSPNRGVLPCGHRFCFHCIQNWADHMSLTGKLSTCPLCKASFTCIIKDAVSSDQKIYSQSIPQGGLANLYVLPVEGYIPYNLPNNASVCCECSSREPEDLLVKCHSCGIRCIHCYCLDPPLFPWTCIACKESPVLRFIHGP